MTTAPTTQAVQSLDDLMRLAGRLESLPLTFDVVMVRKQRAELRAGIEAFVASAVSAHEAEVGRLREALICTRATLEHANNTPGGPINDTIWYDVSETLFDYIDSFLATNQGEQK